MKKRWEACQLANSAPKIVAMLLFLFLMSSAGAPYSSAELVSNNSRPTITVTFNKNTTVLAQPQIYVAGASSPTTTASASRSSPNSNSEWSFVPSSPLSSSQAGTRYELIFDGVDDYRNTKTYSIPFFADTKAPALFQSQPGSGAVINQTSYTLRLVFNESVRILSSTISLQDGTSPESLLSLWVVSADNRTYTLAKSFNSDGIYSLSGTAADNAGNSMAYSIPFTINSVPLEISLLEPPLGVAWKNPFNFTVQTNKHAVCRYAYSPTAFNSMFDFSSYDGWLHSADLTVLAGKSNRSVSVTCQDDFLIAASRQFEISLDPTPPKMTALFVTPLSNPSIRIITYDLENARLWAETDDDTLCYYDPTASEGEVPSTPFDNSFSKSHSMELSSQLQDQQEYRYSVMCRNKAGNSSLTQTINFSVNLFASGDLQVVSPSGTTNSSSVLINITTSKPASLCEYGTSQSAQDISLQRSADGLRHSLRKNVADGKYTWYALCQFAQGATGPVPFSFIVDTTPPHNLSVLISSPVCENTGLHAEYSATDSGSRLDSFMTTIYNGTSKIPSSVLDTGTGDDFDYGELVAGQTYLLYVAAFDNAGNSISADRQFISLDSDSASCDSTPPEINITITNVTKTNRTTIMSNGTLRNFTNTTTIVVVNLTCKDASSGCHGNFTYGIASPKGQCTPTTTVRAGTQIEIASTSLFCYSYKDNNNNTVKGTRLVTVFSPSDLCSNFRKDSGETDVDCGGLSCGKCDNSYSCLSGGDCNSGYCSAAGACAAPTCSDSRLNQDETDVDCGGAVCRKCSLEKSCRSNSDCMDGFCRAGTCSVPPPAVKNETSGLQPPEDEPDQDGLGLAAIILIAVGAALVLAGGGYWAYTQFASKREEAAPLPTVTTQERGSPPIFSRPAAMKERFMQKEKEKEQKRSKILSSFEGEKDEKNEKDKRDEKGEKAERMGDASETELQGIKADVLAKQKKGTDVAESVQHAKKAVNEDNAEEYLEIAKLHEDRAKSNVAMAGKMRREKGKASDQEVFSELSKIAEELPNKDQAHSKNTRSRNAGNAEGVVAKSSAIAPHAEDKNKAGKNSQASASGSRNEPDPFEALAKIAGASPSEAKRLSVKSTVTSDDLLELFGGEETLSRHEKINALNMNLFKLVLSQLLESGKVGKEDVTSTLFELMDASVLSEKDVGKILKDLDLITVSE